MIIVLTGAAGLLGGAIAHELVRGGHSVVGLVHKDSAIQDNDGAELDAPLFDGTLPGAGEIRRLQGDVTKDGLGLSPAHREALANTVDCVIHCAALVRFEADFQSLEAVNVTGTERVASLFPKARFVHVSTAYSCGLREGAIPEEPHGEYEAYGNGYEQSKAIAERRLMALRPDAIIARPSIVLGERETGRIRSFDTIYAAFKFIASGRIKAVPVAPGSTLNFVPIDHVVAGIIALATASQTPPSVVHLVAREAIATETFLSLIGRIEGLRSPQITRPDPAHGVQDSLVQRLIQPYLSYFTRAPRFESHAITRFAGIEAPEMGEDDMLRQIRFCVEAGFIKPKI